jgi:transaldolase
MGTAESAGRGQVSAVQAAGVSVWLDDLDRSRLVSGSLRALVDAGIITGVTTNPAIFAKAISHGGDAYSEALDAAALAGWDADRTVHELVIADVQRACEVLADVYSATGSRDGFVSIEVDPRLAHDSEGTIQAARHLWSEVDRPNVMIKIPATREGLPAITAALADGINVNVTLIFSRERFAEVRAAHRAGLDAARAAGRDLSTIASVASFFVSRLDTAVDPALEASPLAGTTAVANARAAYDEFTQDLGRHEWQSLHGAGAQPQRPLWASTGTKNAAYSPIKYVEELLTADSVNTMPAATLDALLAADSLTSAVESLDPAEAFAAAGIDQTDVMDRLEREGVDAFVTAWVDLIADVERQLAARR